MSEAALETPAVDATAEAVAEDPAVTELKQRNAGLQRKVQELLAEAKARSEGNPEAQEENMPHEVTSTVQETLDAQAQLIRDLYAERWQEKAVAAHPEAAPFRDLLLGGDEAAVMALAEDIATRIKGGQPAEEAVTEATTVEEAAPVSETPVIPPVSGGSPSVEGLQGPTESEALAAARAEARRNPADPRAWDHFLNMKMKMAADGNPLVVYTATQDEGGVGLT